MNSKPWDSDNIRSNAYSWTLEGDGKLLELMQSISQNLEKRALTTKSNMNKIILNLDRTAISLGNAANELSALQHYQFVENRVYEDDETIVNENEVPIKVQVENKFYNPVKIVSNVLKNSITVMERCYEKVSLDIEDSDDEDGLSKSVVYRQNNPYQGHPLPYIIGSKEWKEKLHIGLCDSEGDFSEDEIGDQYSESSESVSPSVSLPSNAQTISGSESSIWGLHTNAPKQQNMYDRSSDDEISSNTGLSKTSSDDIRNIVSRVPAAPVLLKEDENRISNRFYIHKPKNKILFDDNCEESDKDGLENSIEHPKTNIPKQNMVSNVFIDESPNLDEVDKEDPVNLFFDADEEFLPNKKQENCLAHKSGNVDKKKSETLNNIIQGKHVETKKSNIPRKTVNLFDDDDFDSFMSELNTKSKETSQKNTKTRLVQNLFDQSSDEVEPVIDISSNILESTEENNLKTTKELTRTKSEQITNLFEEEISDFLPYTKNITHKILITNIFDDEPPEDEFEHLFRTSNKTNVSSDLKNEADNYANFDSRDTDTDQISSKKGISAEKEYLPREKFEDIFSVAMLTKNAKILSNTKEQNNYFINNTMESANKNIHNSDIFNDDNSFNNTSTNIVENETISNKLCHIISEDNLENDESIEKVIEIPKEIAENLNDTNISKAKSINLFGDISDSYEEGEDLFNPYKKAFSETVTSISILNQYSDKISVISENPKSPHEQFSEETESRQKNIFNETKQNENSNNLKSQLFTTSLFDDTSLEENVFEITSKGTPETENVEENILGVPTLTYDPLRLYDDIPPEDDFQCNIDSKRHNIFFDDYSDTIIESDISKKEPTSNYNIFSDEPPPDDLILGMPNSLPMGNKDSDELNQSNGNENLFKHDGNSEFSKEVEPEATQSTVADLIQKVSKTNEDAMEEKFKTKRMQPKKLDTHLNINIAALLPGAKRVRNKLLDNISTQSCLSETVSRQIYTFPTIVNESDPSQLFSFNKTRARIQVKRKPSTRKGRQANYEKSLNEDKSGTAEKLFKKYDKDSFNNSTNANISVLGNDFGAVSLTPNTSSETNTNLIEENDEKDDVIHKNQNDIKNIPILSSTPNIHHAKNNRTLKENLLLSSSIFPDDSDEDIFSNIQKNTKPDISLTKQENKAPKLFITDDEDDDLFKKSSNNEITQKKLCDERSNFQNNQNKFIASKNTNVSITTVQHAVKTNLFDDIDDDDDDLFGGGKASNTNIKNRVNSDPISKQSSKDGKGIIKTSKDDGSDNPLADLLNN